MNNKKQGIENFKSFPWKFFSKNFFKAKKIFLNRKKLSIKEFLFQQFFEFNYS